MAELKSNITIGKHKKSVDNLAATINWNALALEAMEKFISIVDGEDAVKHIKAEQQIDGLKTSLNLYKLDAGTYPETKQGLSALRQIPTTGKIPKNWRRGGYVFKEERFIDPWGNKLIYKSPGRYSDYEIISYGADGQPGGDNENEDIKFSAP
jgi:general secretion pathway protein G